MTDLTDLLTPPPEHVLPAGRVGEIRAAVLRVAAEPRPHHSRRRLWWVAVPLVAALALLAAIGFRVADAPSVIGSPSPTPVTTSAALPAGSVETDAGALDEQQARGVIAAVDRPSDLRPGALVEVLVARRLTTALGEGTFVVWSTADASTWFTVKIPGELETSGPITGPAATKPPRLPDAEHPVTRLTDLSVFGWRTDADRPDANASDLHSAQVYLTVPTVERVEVRMTIEGTPGPWFSTPVHDGYAMVPAVAMGRHSTTENVDKVTTIEDRAWDANGTQVPIRAR